MSNEPTRQHYRLATGQAVNVPPSGKSSTPTPKQSAPSTPKKNPA